MIRAGCRSDNTEAVRAAFELQLDKVTIVMHAVGSKYGIASLLHVFDGEDFANHWTTSRIRV
jgi:hypothetical protein